MKYRLIISIIFLGLLIYVVSQTIKISDLQKIIFGFPKQQLIFLLTISFLISTLKSLRFYLLLKNSSIKVSFWRTLRTSLAGSAVTPLPGGEAFRGVLLKHDANARMKETSGPIIVQAYLELFSASIMMLIGSLIFQQFRVAAAAALVLMLFIAMLLINKKFIGYFLAKTEKISFLHKALIKIKNIQIGVRENFIDLESKLPDKIFVRALTLSFIAHILGGVLIFFIAESYGVRLDFLKSIFIYSIGIVIAGIGTISPGGLGFTEGGMVGALLVSGVDISKAVAVVLLYRFTTLIFNIFIGMVLILVFYHKIILKKKK